MYIILYYYIFFYSCDAEIFEITSSETLSHFGKLSKVKILMKNLILQNDLQDLLTIDSIRQINKQTTRHSPKNSIIKVHGSIGGTKNNNSLLFLSFKSIPKTHELVFDFPHRFMLSLLLPFPQHAVHFVYEDDAWRYFVCQCKNCFRIFFSFTKPFFVYLYFLFFYFLFFHFFYLFFLFFIFIFFIIFYFLLFFIFLFCLFIFLYFFLLFFIFVYLFLPFTSYCRH